MPASILPTFCVGDFNTLFPQKVFAIRTLLYFALFRVCGKQATLVSFLSAFRLGWTEFGRRRYNKSDPTSQVLQAPSHTIPLALAVPNGFYGHRQPATRMVLPQVVRHLLPQLTFGTTKAQLPHYIVVRPGAASDPRPPCPHPTFLRKL